MTEPMLPPSHPGSVVLELGGDLGALVVHVPPELSGLEIDTSPLRDARRHTHSEVRERLLPAGVVHAAVFPALEAGEHTIWSPQGPEVGIVCVVAGSVTEVDWPGLCRHPADGVGGRRFCDPVVAPIEPNAASASPDPKEKHPR